MLGLKRRTVKLECYPDEWSVEFIKSKSELRKLLKDIDVQIEHIGSTSIDGVWAKPILDVGVGVKSEQDIVEVIKVLLANGYIDRGDRKERGGYLMVLELAPEITSHHIHILEVTDRQWEAYLRFRDRLRANKQLAKEYENLKLELIRRYNGDRVKYTNGKNVFIQRVLKSIDA